LQRARYSRHSPMLLLSLFLFGIAELSYALDPAILLQLEQAPDVGCDDSLDDPFSTQVLALAPGNNCVHYRLTAVNSSLEPAYNVVISDLTPVFTTYHKLLGCSVVDCLVTEPQLGEVGQVTGEVPVLQPGESIELIFAVKLD